MENSKKYLCIKTTNESGVIVSQLSKCPANPEMVMAALQFISSGIKIEISVQDDPIDFSKEVNL